MAAWCLTIAGRAKASRLNSEEEVGEFVGRYREDAHLSDTMTDGRKHESLPCDEITPHFIPIEPESISTPSAYSASVEAKQCITTRQLPKRGKRRRSLKTERRRRPITRSDQNWNTPGANDPDRPAPSSACVCVV